MAHIHPRTPWEQIVGVRENWNARDKDGRFSFCAVISDDIYFVELT